MNSSQSRGSKISTQYANEVSREESEKIGNLPLNMAR